MHQGGDVGTLIVVYSLHLLPHLLLETHLGRRTVLLCLQVDGPHGEGVLLSLHVLCPFEVVFEVVVDADLHGGGGTL